VRGAPCAGPEKLEIFKIRREMAKLSQKNTLASRREGPLVQDPKNSKFSKSDENWLRYERNKKVKKFSYHFVEVTKKNINYSISSKKINYQDKIVKLIQAAQRTVHIKATLSSKRRSLTKVKCAANRHLL